ncbi:copia protein [Tanacetum coccineum]
MTHQSSFLLSQGFSKGTVDPTLFISRKGKDILLVQIYVDDILFASTTIELCDKFSDIMCSKFKMSMIGKISFFLGLQISQSPRGIFLNQSKYVLESLKKYGMESCDPVDTPMVEKSKLDEDTQGKAVDPTHYRGLVGTLMYLTSSRPDLVMAAPIISISFDLPVESVPIVPADLLVAPNVGTVSVISPDGVLDLMDYSSSSDSDQSEDSLPPVLDLPLVLPFLCSNDSEVDCESEPAKQRPERHESFTPSSEFPLAPIVSLSRIRRRSTTLIRLGEAIPFGRLYRTHPNGPRKLLTARKRVGPIPACRLAWRCVSHHSSDRHSSPDSSSSSSHSDHSLSGHTPLDTTDVDSSTPQRFVHLSLTRTSRRSDAFRRWRSAPLSTPNPPTTSESSLGSFSERSIAPTHADLLPPQKRFRDSYSPEDSGEEHMAVDTADAEAVADVGISDGVLAYTKDGVGMRVEITASDVREDDEEFDHSNNDYSSLNRKWVIICPRILNQDFVAPPSEEDLVTFIQELGYFGRCASLGKQQDLIDSGSHELKSCRFVSKKQDYQHYGALIPDDMINQNIKDSEAYKTYYDFATGKVPPRKARKPAKKSTTAPTSGVVIKDTPVVSVSKKKAPAKANRSIGIEILSDVADSS